MLKLYPVNKLCCFLLLLFASSQTANSATLQYIEIPSSFNPVGSGARALGMGGAFIGIADDATAASWNPGGLIQLERPEISVVGGAISRQEDNYFSVVPEADGRQSVTNSQLNYLSAALPFRYKGHNMVVALNYQHLFSFDRNWRFALHQEEPDLTRIGYVDHQQSGRLSGLGFAWAVRLTPTWSIGTTLNIWDSSNGLNGWRVTTRDHGNGIWNGKAFTYSSNSLDTYSFDGINANFGVLWNSGEHLSFGAVLKTPFTADLIHEENFDANLNISGTPPLNISATDLLHETLDMPISYGVGIAWRFSDQLTVAADLYRTQWEDFTLQGEDGSATSPINGKPISAADINATLQARIGLEYLFMSDSFQAVIPLRTGFFYDPAPATGGPDDYYGITLGTGIAYDRIIIDAAYQYRFGRDVGSSILQDFEFSQDVTNQTIYISCIIHI